MSDSVKRTWRMINRGRNKYGQVITKVTVVEYGEKIEIIDQIAIERVIMKNDDKRFNLEYGTPLLDKRKIHHNLGHIDSPE